jgi:hypothetical protein
MFFTLGFLACGTKLARGRIVLRHTPEEFISRHVQPDQDRTRPGLTSSKHTPPGLHPERLGMISLISTECTDYGPLISLISTEHTNHYEFPSLYKHDAFP